jgi:hypothetical protein
MVVLEMQVLQDLLELREMLELQVMVVQVELVAVVELVEMQLIHLPVVLEELLVELQVRMGKGLLLALLQLH